MNVLYRDYSRRRSTSGTSTSVFPVRSVGMSVRSRSAVDQHGRSLRKDPQSGGGRFFRRRVPGGLAGEQNEEKVPGLEEKAAAAETV